MSDFDLLLRGSAFVIIACSIVLSRVLIGRGIDNIPYWAGIFLTFIYACYLFFGIHFANGSSTAAELMFAVLMAANTLFFVIGMRCVRRKIVPLQKPLVKYYLPRLYLIALILISIGFYILLTQGKPWRLFTDTVGLKFERLTGIAEKDPILLNIDALVQAMTMVSFVWTVLAYRDDKKSRKQLYFTSCLLLLYCLSTGSRSPFIGMLVLALAALAEGRKHSRHLASLAKKKWYFIAALIAGGVFFIGVTAMRIEVEVLDKDVFGLYFGIDNFGVVDGLLDQASASSFFLSTVIVYAANTFNNFIIRFEELSNIIPTMGYRFTFFYVAATQILLPDFFPQELEVWRDLAKANNQHLAMISDAAGQWSTPYGDLLWDFGIFGAVVVTALVSGIAGYIVNKARSNPNFYNLLLKVMVVAFSIVPLVNPLLSLYVHYGLFIVVAAMFRSRIYSKSASGN